MRKIKIVLIFSSLVLLGYFIINDTSNMNDESLSNNQIVFESDILNNNNQVLKSNISIKPETVQNKNSSSHNSNKIATICGEVETKESHIEIPSVNSNETIAKPKQDKHDIPLDDDKQTEPTESSKPAKLEKDTADLKTDLVSENPIIQDHLILCPNAWFDELKPCNYIPDNLKAVDELGREVPFFNTSQEAWNWGENEIENNKSGYGCRGFTRMDGHYNNGKQFFFAYLKVCDN